MFLRVLLLSAVLLLGSGCNAVSFVPSMDIMTYGADGELITIWGEHNFYTDTSSFGGVLRRTNTTILIGDYVGRQT